MTDTSEICRIPGTTRAAFPHIALATLTLCTFFIHGYHPLAEDGGIYVAGIESSLNPLLFPHDLAFATATQHYSLFGPVMAHIVGTLHVPLPWLLLVAYIAGTWLMLYATWSIAAQCFHSDTICLYATALLSAWFTLPIAGTSLLLMDPYVTARTLSTPLSLLAIAFALPLRWRSTDATRRTNRAALLRCVLCIAATAAFHALMAAYAASFILTLLVAKLPSRRIRIFGWTVLASAALATAIILQATAPAESAATAAAAFSRYYWFLSQWQWFEWLGLAGPLVVFALLLRFTRTRIGEPGIALCRASFVIGIIATVISSLFAHEHYSTHFVARMQPLRTFLLPYAVMIVLLGGILAQTRRRFLPALFPIAMMGVMFFVQRQTFPASQHIELPWHGPTNPWSQAFVWAREHTPANALFALDANYITTDGEDGQTFRATAQRSVLPDFSKDGGEAAIRPSLAEDWLAGQSAQKDLSRLNDSQRMERLQPLGVSWVILRADARTSTICPYENAFVKVCPLR